MESGISMKQRKTIQRQILLRTVKSLKCHPTTEEVYEAVSKEYPHISLATVYRNLNLMAQNGDIGKIPVGDAAYRFDAGAHPHYHIRCSVCGSFTDVNSAYCSEIDKMIEERTGYSISGHSLIFDGVCPECRKNEEKTDGEGPKDSKS